MNAEEKKIQKLVIKLLHSGSNLKKTIDAAANKSVKDFIELHLYRDGFEIRQQIKKILNEHYDMGFKNGCEYYKKFDRRKQYGNGKSKTGKNDIRRNNIIKH